MHDRVSTGTPGFQEMMEKVGEKQKKTVDQFINEVYQYGTDINVILCE